MSGSNPFRRKQPAQAGSEVPGTSDNEITRAVEHLPSLDTELARQTQKATRKTVRIVSPHSSTSDSGDNGHHSPSAYFDYRIRPKKEYLSTGVTSSKSSANTLPVDPFDGEPGIDDTSEKASLHTGHADITVSEGLDVEDVLSQSPRRTPSMPSNPFSRASRLAEEDTKTSAQSDQSVRGPAISMSSPMSSSRAPLDVDAFKRLLLTGDKDPTPNSAPPTPSASGFSLHGIQHGDSSSNTDASSLSRQSILGSQTDLHLETPRTSHEISPSDEDHQYQFQPRSPVSERFSSPVYRSRGGKATKGASPQTVAFAEPASYTSQYELAPPLSPMTKSPRSHTDLNKPLPLPPPPTSHSPNSLTDTSGSISLNTTEPLSGSPAVSATRVRVAPPPPLSRRLSQLRSQHPSNSSGTSTSIAEENVAELLSSPISTKPPAPPPPRRRGTDRSQTSSETRFPSELEADVGKPLTKSQSPKPPPPPRRNPSLSSAKLPRRVSPNVPKPSSMPPPPPPRRRASSGSSFGSRRVSSEVNHEDVEGHHAGISAGSSIDTDLREIGNEKDVLADLSALQREVDALRGKYERRDSTDKT